MEKRRHAVVWTDPSQTRNRIPPAPHRGMPGRQDLTRAEDLYWRFPITRTKKQGATEGVGNCLHTQIAGDEFAGRPSVREDASLEKASDKGIGSVAGLWSQSPCVSIEPPGQELSKLINRYSAYSGAPAHEQAPGEGSHTRSLGKTGTCSPFQHLHSPLRRRSDCIWKIRQTRKLRKTVTIACESQTPIRTDPTGVGRVREEQQHGSL